MKKEQYSVRLFFFHKNAKNYILLKDIHFINILSYFLLHIYLLTLNFTLLVILKKYENL